MALTPVRESAFPRVPLSPVPQNEQAPAVVAAVEKAATPEPLPLSPVDQPIDGARSPISANRSLDRSRLRSPLAPLPNLIASLGRGRRSPAPEKAGPTCEASPAPAFPGFAPPSPVPLRFAEPPCADSIPDVVAPPESHPLAPSREEAAEEAAVREANERARACGLASAVSDAAGAGAREAERAAKAAGAFCSSLWGRLVTALFK
jgi:hypothetical protein